jgi:hypothetical protein
MEALSGSAIKRAVKPEHGGKAGVCAIGAHVVELECEQSQIYDSVAGVGDERFANIPQAIHRAVTGQDDRPSNDAE